MRPLVYITMSQPDREPFLFTDKEFMQYMAEIGHGRVGRTTPNDLCKQIFKEYESARKMFAEQKISMSYRHARNYFEAILLYYGYKPGTGRIKDSDDVAFVKGCNRLGISGTTVPECCKTALGMPVYKLRLEEYNRDATEHNIYGLLLETIRATGM